MIWSSKVTKRSHRTKRTAPTLVVLCLVAAACAGDVGEYRDAAGDMDGDQSTADGVVSDSIRKGGPVAGGENADEFAGLDGSGPDGEVTAPESTVAPSDAGITQPSTAQSTPPPGADPGRGGDVGVTPTQVVLGLFYSKTGHYAALQRNWQRVVEAAFNEVNEKGGVHGRQLVLKTYDDGGSDASTITANERRARDEVFAFMSSVSTTNEVLSSLAEKDRIPAVVGILTEDLGKTLRYSFTAFPYWATSVKILPSFIENRLKAGDKKIGVVFESTRPAANAKDIFKREASRAGLDVVFEQPIAVNQATCANEVTNLQSRGVELVFMMNGPLGAICMLRDARAFGYRPSWTGVGPSWGLNAVASASGGGADGISMLGATTTLETPAGKHYARIMRKYFPGSGAETDDVALVMYAVVQLYIEALVRTGPALTREAFIEAMETKMGGFDSGYLPPPRFGPNDRSGPQAESVVRCCTDNQWTTTDTTWRERF